jgi:ribosomal protein L11 methyltransferase
MPFYEIEFPLAGLDPETVETALFDRGASSITLVDRGDEPVLEPRPGEIRLWSDTLVRALFDATADSTRDAIRQLAQLEDLFGGEILREARVRSVADQVWERVWLTDWKPMRFGRRLWVSPTTAAPPDDPDAVVVWLDPGLAFGTGTHPTTALCLEALAELDLRQKSVVDYGCGSGILGIAALKLGAARVTAVDLDPQALLASRDNAERNGVAHNLVTQDPGRPVAMADCVVANILAAPLLELRPVLTQACRAGGVLLLSGILTNQAEEVIAGYRPWFDIVDVVRREDWCRIHAARRGDVAAPGVS